MRAANGEAGAQELLKRADVAMYHEKAGGGGRCEIFDPAAVVLLQTGTRPGTTHLHAR